MTNVYEIGSGAAKIADLNYQSTSDNDLRAITFLSIQYLAMAQSGAALAGFKPFLRYTNSANVSNYPEHEAWKVLIRLIDLTGDFLYLYGSETSAGATEGKNIVWSIRRFLLKNPAVLYLTDKQISLATRGSQTQDDSYFLSYGDENRLCFYRLSDKVQHQTKHTPVSYTHLTLPTILRV